MKKLLLFLFLFTLGATLFVQNTSAQVTTNSSSGLAPTYTTLAGAITALNGATITAPVVITLDAASPQTAPAGGYSITATGTVANTITINGSNNTITAPTPQTSGQLYDAIFKIIGGDYITIDGFTMLENAANTTTVAASNNMTEWGVALLYSSTTNGAQFNTVKNCTITLNRTYQNTFGIYSNSTHSATAVTTSATATTAAGGNSGLVITGNTISNVNNGIVVIGPTAAADNNDGLTIGGSGNANTITNYGTTGTFSGYANVSGTVNGILVRNTKNFVVSYNTITSSNGGVTAGTINGIQIPAFSNAPTGTFTNSINNNILSVKSGLIAGTINGINALGTSASVTSTLNINNNDFNNFGHTVAGTAAITFISNVGTHLNQNINYNTFTNISVNTTGSVTFISNNNTLPALGTRNTNNNAIVTAFGKTGAGGTVTIFTTGASSPTGSTLNETNNNFSNITVTGATTLLGWSNLDGGTPTKTFQNNTFNNWAGGTSAITVIGLGYCAAGSIITGNTITNITGQAGITGLQIGTSSAFNAYSNTISNLSSTGTGGTVLGISITSGSDNVYQNVVHTLSSTGSASVISGVSVSGATLHNIYGNKIYNLSGNQTGSIVNGINVTAGTAVNIYNNLIGDLKATAATGLNAINGINASASATYNVYYNTIELNATSSSATTFGTSCITFSSTATAFNSRNNVLVNLSTPAQEGLNVAANGISACLRRSAGTTGTVPGNYATTSNTNAYWCNPTAGTNNHLTYVEGTGTITNPYNTVAGFATFLVNRDQLSVEENPTFVSTTGTDATFLHINTVTPTKLESGGAPIATYTLDFDGDTRSVTLPDIGADEFAGIPSGIAPVADFSADNTAPFAGQTVIFTDLSTNTPTSWSWTVTPGTYLMADGTTLASKNPHTIFTAAGVYTIELTATNAIGSNTMTKTNYINAVNPASAPVADFSASATVITNGGPVTFTDLSTNYPTSWLWSFTPNTVSYIAGSATSQNPQVLFNGAGEFTVELTATNGVGGNTMTKGKYITNSLVYCTSAAASSGDEDITMVQFGSTLNNTSACASLTGTQGVATGTANLYSDFTAIAATQVVQGATQAISVQITECAATAYSHSVMVYIDFNQNGLFTDAGEEFNIWPYASSNTHTIATTIAIPVGAILGNTRLRIVCKENATTGPCLVSSWGETEDYTINVIAPGAPTMAAAPGSLDFGSTVPSGGTSAEMTYSLSASFLTPAAGNITIAPPANFEVSTATGGPYYSTPITVAYTGSTLAATTIYVVFKPTAASTLYTGNIANSGGGATTTNVAVTGTSSCGTFPVPFTENFDTYTVPAVGCGTVIDVNTDLVKWATTTGTTYNGANKLSIGYSAVGVPMNDWYITAGLDLTGGKSYDVKFYYRVIAATYPENMEVKWGNAPTVAGMTSSAIFSQTGMINTTYTLGATSFTPATTGTYYVGWHCNSAADMDGIYLDQITVTETPPCPAPLTATATPVSDVSISVGWTGTAPTVVIDYGPVGHAAGTGTLVTGVVDNPKTISGLTANTTYDVYVQQDCGGGSYSPWTAVTTVTTLCAAITAGCEHFDTQLQPSCWTLSGPQNWLFTNTWPAYGAAGVTDHTGNSGSIAGVDGSGSASLTGITMASSLIDVSALTLPQVRFFVFNNNTTPGITNEQKLVVNVLDGATVIATYTWDYGVNFATWQEIKIPFTKPVSNLVQLKFVVDKNSGSPYYDDMIVDDICVEERLPTGTLSGIVTNAAAAAIKDATVSFSTFTTTTDPTGYYEFLGVEIGTYSVACSKAGYVTSTAAGVVVTEGATTTQNFSLAYLLDPPATFQASILTMNDAHLTWQAPGSVPDQWIKWDNGTNTSAIGTNAAADFDVASRWPVADITSYSGMYLKKVRFFPSVASASCTYTIKIWKGANAATLLYSQVVTSPTVGAFNDITLTTPVLIDGSSEFWFGYNVNTTTGYPAGCDAGPAVAGKGNMIYWTGVWQELTVLNAALIGNWNLAGFVSASAAKSMDPLIPMEPITKNRSANSTSIQQVAADNVIPNGGAAVFSSIPSSDASASGVNMTSNTNGNSLAPLGPWTVLGYNVYRNGSKVNGIVPLTDLFYDDLDLPAGDYSFGVTAVYAEGESAPAGPIALTVYSCPAATLLAYSDVTTTDATFTWTPAVAGPTNWVVEYGPTGFAHGTGISVPVSGTSSLTVYTLTPATTYDVYVRTDCGGSDFSAWDGPQTFTTQCATVSTFPYSENFDAATRPAIPICWSQYSSAAARPWVTSNSAIGSLSAPNFVGVFYSATAAKDEWLVSPAIALTTGTAYQVKFWVQAPGYFGVPEKLKLVVSTDPSLSGMASGTVIWDDPNMLLDAYTEFTVPFTPAAAGPYYFGWYAYSDMDVDYIAMDNVSIVETPTAKELDVVVYLEGPYAGSRTMNTMLFDNSLIPLAQPFNTAPWSYAGTESVVAVPADIVDWVLVDIRDAATPEAALPETSIWKKACFLKSDGQIVDLDGTTLPSIGNPTVINNLYVVVRHRNHIAVMSSAGMALNVPGDAYVFDFSSSVDQAYGSGAGFKEIETGVFGMVAGDSDADGDIGANDYTAWAIDFGNNPVYFSSDNDLDGDIGANDYTKWAVNFGISNPILAPGRNSYKSQVPNK